MFADKILLITGGTGSFGNAVAARFLPTRVKEIRIFSRDEKKQHDMRTRFNHPKLRFYLGDVRQPESVSEALAGTDYVFHAAALKQVPSSEFFPLEAVKTNILGAENVINAAVGSNVEKVIVLSTDKAVYPINAMGMTKALMEKVALAKARHLSGRKPTICVVRYGNVIATRGSVIPVFLEQIRRGGELTVTDPGMTRFMMPLDRAIELVLHAFRHGRAGDIFVQKAPAATIGDLAAVIKEMLGAPNRIKIIGTRHGEKLHETLLTREEMNRAEKRGEYFRVPLDARNLNYDEYFVEGEKKISEQKDYTSADTRRLDRKAIKKMLAADEHFTAVAAGKRDYE